jgi:hypothetical protein
VSNLRFSVFFFSPSLSQCSWCYKTEIPEYRNAGENVSPASLVLPIVQYRHSGTCYSPVPLVTDRVSSKQTNKIFGSNRNKPKLNLFWFIFGLFRETNKSFFRFVSVRFGVSDPFRNNQNKQNCFQTNRKTKKIVEKGVKASKIVFRIWPLWVRLRVQIPKMLTNFWDKCILNNLFQQQKTKFLGT